MVVPHDYGSKVVKIKYEIFNDLDPGKPIEKVDKPEIARLTIPTNSFEIRSA
jgi:hypothetical protein